MASHTLGTRDEWLAARLELLEAEKELTRRSDELARRRRDLPWVPLDKLVAYKRRMGWDFRWVSSLGSSFNYDFHVTIDPAEAPVEYNYRGQAQLEAENVAWRDWSGEQPGMSAFARDGDDVFHTYFAYARGLDGLWTMWQWLDRAPLGRDEGDLSWLHRHDQYPATAGGPS